MNQAKYIGMDVHQATISVAVMDSAGKLILESILETKSAIPNHNRSERRNRLGVNSRLSLISGPSRTSDPHCFNIAKLERMLFVNIPAGSFMMRCSAGDRECYAEEKPIHRVSITRPSPANRFVDASQLHARSSPKERKEEPDDVTLLVIDFKGS